METKEGAMNAKCRNAEKRQPSEANGGRKDTKQLLKDAFWELLNEKEYDKITVRDIVEKCGVNRNTFYYHYRDIPSLLSETINDWADEIDRQKDNIKSPLELIVPVALECKKRQRAILHIYDSLQKGVFQDSFDKLSLSFSERYIDTTHPENPLDKESRDLLVRLCKCVVKGIMIDWVESGMEYDLVKTAVQVYGIFYESKPH